MRDGRPRPPLWWLFGDTFRTDRVHLSSPLSKTQAKHALDLAGAAAPIPSHPGTARLAGHLSGDHLVAGLRRIRRGPTFVGDLREVEHGGVELAGHIRWPTSFRLVATVNWTLAIGLAVIGLAVGADWAAFGPVLFVWLWLGAIISTAIDRTTWLQVRAALSETLQATEVTGDAPV